MLDATTCLMRTRPKPIEGPDPAQPDSAIANTGGGTFPTPYRFDLSLRAVGSASEDIHQVVSR